MSTHERRLRRRSLLIAAAFAPLARAQGTASEAEANLRRFMQQARTPPAALSELPAEERNARMQQRAALLARGEAALARNDAAAALLEFEQAAALLHAADAEMGLVRTYMQGGEYRRALAFVAHTASAHREVPGGAALYAWLLHIGGQSAAAQRLLHDAQARFGNDALLAATQMQLNSAQPLASGALLMVPARLAPFDTPNIVPVKTRVAASGVLIDGGTRAIAPLGAVVVAGAGAIWLRNGIGRVSRAQIERRIDALGVVVLRLAVPLAAAAELVPAPRDPFPGSIGYAIEYVSSDSATPRWPLLRAGFFGAATGNGADRSLGIEHPPGPRGGPVFDAWGQWAGIALARRHGSDQLLPVSRLRPLLASAAVGAATEKKSAEQVYEAALRAAVQIIMPR
jgi:tetratricopeptide (TPR) repeat protein